MAEQETFAQSELALALSEQGFGIQSYAMIGKGGTAGTELEATAEVVLLEGIVVEISLTARGYQFKGNGDQVYETIEDALRAVSPKYVEASQQRLMAKLAEVAASR